MADNASRRGAVDMGTPLMILAFAVIGGFLYWLNGQAAAERALDIVEDTATGGALAAPPRPASDLPVLGTIAAGAPIATLETPEVLAFEELAPPGKDVYVLRVQGNSMIEDSIRDGDLVVVERTQNAWNGQIVVAVLADEEATLKRYYEAPDGRIRLQPANAAMKPIVVPEVEIRGVVLGVIRRY